MTDFKKKVVWVVGASSGIGKEAAIQFNIAGAKVVLSSRNEADLLKLKEQLPNSEDSMVLALDVTKAETFGSAAEEVYQTFGKVDILFCSAGVSQRALVVDTDMGVDRKIMEVNYFGTIGLAKMLLPRMIKDGGGHFAVLSSIVGKFGFNMRSAYAASKHALHGFFESLYFENKENGIKITMIVPGPIQTNISINALDGKGKSTGQMDAMQKEGIAVGKAVALMLNAIKKNKKEIIIGGAKEKIGAKLVALWPSLFFKLTAKQNPQGKV